VWRLQFGAGFEIGPGVLAQLYGSKGMTVVLTMAPRLNVKLRVTNSFSIVASGDFTFTGLNYAQNGVSDFRWFVYPTLSGGVLVTF